MKTNSTKTKQNYFLSPCSESLEGFRQMYVLSQQDLDSF